MNRLTVSALAIVAAWVVSSCAVNAQTYTFTGSGMNNSMSLSSNWMGSVVPTSGDPNLKIIFAGPFASAFQDVANPLVVQDLQFNIFFQLQGNAISMDNLGANPTITVSSNTDIFMPVNFNAPTTITSSPNGGINFFGVLTGNNLTFSTGGFATYAISGSGTSLGGVTAVNPNVQLHVNQAGAFSGTLNVAGIAQFNAVNALAAGTDVNVSPGGQVALNANNVVDDLDVSGGLVSLGGNLSVTGGISSSSGVGVIGSNIGALALGGPTTINVTSGGTDHLNINGQISTGSLNKTGAGKLVLSYFGANNFTGTNTVTAGTLRGTADTIGTVVNNSTVELFAGTFNTPQISGPGNVVISGGGATYNVAQPYTGTTTIDGGSLSGFVTSLPALITGVGAGGAVVFNDTSNVANTSTIAGNLNVFKSTPGVLTMSGNNPYTGGTTLFGGGLAIGSDTAIGSGPLFFFTSTQTLEAIGSRTLANPLQIGAGVTFQGGGDFNFTDPTPKVLSGQLLHNSSSNTVIVGKYDVNLSGVLTVNAGSLTLGDASIVNGFTSAGPVTVSGGTLTLNSLNFINLPTVTLAGGTLSVPNGYAIPLGAVLQGTGGVTGRLATANGSTIIASGNLTLGDAAHPAGVNLDGELYTNNNIVTLDDSNQAVLGSLTDLGTATLDGTLVSPNGLVLNFGRNLVGRGQIQSNNTLADAVIVNGDVNGDSISTPLVFNGYVKGVGTFNNVAFSGTFSPGLSPTLLTVGNTVLLPSNVLDIEIGGLNRGSQYDAFDVLPSSTMVFDGTFQVSLINAFNPSLGDQFNIFDGTTTGVFSSFNLPALNTGLAWDTSLLYTQGIIQVVNAIPEPATVWMACVVGVVALKRRRAA
jgi:autotransporter-associated beta strand protein